MKANPNIVLHHPSITRQQRQVRNGHRGIVIWFTGLSGSGKSTLAHLLEQRLFEMGCQTVVLDGDNVRHGLCSDLSFSEDDRRENIRRIGEVAKLLAETGLIAITAFISPFRADRARVRSMMPHGDFIEVFVDCSLEVCEGRDVKGLYKRARAGEIKGYTGIDSPYEAPLAPELLLDTNFLSIDDAVAKLLALLLLRGLLRE